MPETTADYFSPRAFERACNRSGLTRKRIAEALGVTPTTMSSLTSGRTTPSLKLLHRIVEVFGGELSDYLTLPPKSRWKLQHFRIAHGYTQAALAKCIGVHPSLVSSWEQDRYPPSEDAAKKLAELYGVPALLIREIGAAKSTPAAQSRAKAASAAAAIHLAESVLAYADDALVLAHGDGVRPEETAAIHAQIRGSVEQALALLGTLIPQLPPARRVAAYKLVRRLTEVFEGVSET